MTIRLILILACFACGVFSKSIEATSSSESVQLFAIANRTPHPQEVVFYQYAGDHAPDSLRKRVPPNTRIVVNIDLRKLRGYKIPEIEIVGLETLRDVELLQPTELVIYEGTVETAQQGFFEIARPTKRHAEAAAELEAQAARERDRRAAEYDAMRSRPDQPGYKLGPDKPFKVGDAIVGWRNLKYWHEGYVIGTRKGLVAVEYSDDGARDELPAKPSHIRHRIGGKGRYVYRPPAQPIPSAPSAPSAPAVTTQKSPPTKACHGRGYRTDNQDECCSKMLAPHEGWLYCCNYDSGKGFCDLAGPSR